MRTQVGIVGDEDGGFRRQIQLAQLRYTVSSTAAMTSLAENYVGLASASV